MRKLTLTISAFTLLGLVACGGGKGEQKATETIYVKEEVPVEETYTIVQTPEEPEPEPVNPNAPPFRFKASYRPMTERYILGQTTKVPEAQLDIDMTLSENGYTSGTRRYVVYYYQQSYDGTPSDSAIYTDDLAGSWKTRERKMGNGYQTVYEISPGSLKDVWYLPEDHQVIFAYPGKDNWADMIDNKTGMAFKVRSFQKL